MTLAIDGGTPIRAHDYPAWPHFDENEERALLRSLHQGTWWRATGTENAQLEQEFAAFHNAAHAVTVANGTVALEIALQSGGIGPGDEVIVPAFTFISTAMAAQRIGAIPIAVDVLPDSYCIDPDQIETFITDKTKAIIPVHMSGHFCDMPRIVKIAERHNLLVVQDAAHAHGAVGPNGKGVGDWGTMACFSFQNFKLMTAGEGGIITCPTKEMREKAFLISNCGRPADDRNYQHVTVGVNARLPEFSASVLRAQLQRLEKQTITREANARLLSSLLEDDHRLQIQGHTEQAQVHPHYMYIITLENRTRNNIDRHHFVECLKAEGLPAFVAYQALYRIPCFNMQPTAGIPLEQYALRCPVTEHIAARGIWLHHRALLGDEGDTRDVAAAITKVLNAHD